MSAINVIQQRDSIHIVADGAGYDAAGSLLLTMPKVWPLLKQNAMFAVRGPGVMLSVLSATLAAMPVGYDGMRGCIVDALREAATMNAAARSMCQAGEEFEFVAAGWSERDGADSYVVASHAGLGVEPWTVVRLGPVAQLPGGDEIHRAFHAAFPNVTSGDDLEPERDGLKMLEMQRRHGIRVGTAEGMCIVGGFAQIATVHKSGSFATRIFHHWPDRVGAKTGEARKLEAA